jgi:hypothetical protein
MGVGYVHRMAGEEVTKQGGVVASAPAGEGKRVHLESGCAGILLELRTGGAGEANLHAAFGKAYAEMESGK